MSPSASLVLGILSQRAGQRASLQSMPSPNSAKQSTSVPAVAKVEASAEGSNREAADVQDAVAAAQPEAHAVAVTSSPAQPGAVRCQQQLGSQPDASSLQQLPVMHDQAVLEASVKQTGLDLAAHVEAVNSAVPSVLAECLASNRIKRMPGGDPLEVRLLPAATMSLVAMPYLLSQFVCMSDKQLGSSVVMENTWLTMLLDHQDDLRCLC